jgi:hypothetical protein
MRLDVLATAITRVVEHRRRRCSSAKGTIVTHIDPAASGDGIALGEHRHRGVVAV